ncbi:hypothetical protein [Streptomyces fumanus]|uniref:Uncharacterized protein n=1 Tax=Streptomyces fumanus TaxID=67302 RepID=A0A919A0G5_9ACTN|nr:hypothetical protein [Streptomyces fumanus]GHE82193.1 hypothetical protein GCM10018772_00280 [Streptomyces fumanus]
MTTDRDTRARARARGGAPRRAWTALAAAVAVVLGPAAATASTLDRANAAPPHGSDAASPREAGATPPYHSARTDPRKDRPPTAPTRRSTA